MLKIVIQAHPVSGDRMCLHPQATKCSSKLRNGPVGYFQPPGPRVENYYFFHEMMGKIHKINYSKVT